MCTLKNYIVWFIFKNTIYQIFFTLSFVFAQDPIVNIPQGRIVGTKVYSENSIIPIEIYYGVPYATSPTGRYRFSAPERPPGWRKTYSAHRMHPRCPQVIDDNKDENYNEDCLFLNIWTSRRADGKSLPVVVILYSETWDRAGSSLPCEELSAEGLVVVTVTFRLSVLSFFTLRSIAARGNLALLDQYMALLWVRDNISAFGGDPSAVTLIGHSAGADSILYHLVSPRATGLFQRAILMSPRDIWKAVDEAKVVNATEIENISRKISLSLGCVGELDPEILHCMQDRPLSDLMTAYSRFNVTNIFQPVPDDFLPVGERYLPISLATALSATKQPIMQLDLLLGTTDLEDVNHYDVFYRDLLNQSPSYIYEYANTKKIPEMMKMFSIHQSDGTLALSQAVRWEYWNVKSSKDHGKETLEAVEGLARMESSAKWSVGSALLAARLARKISRLYVYRYLQPSVTDLRGHPLNFTGAVHGADLLALLGDALMLQIARRHSTPEERRTSMLFRQYVVNFIKFGSPGNEGVWPRYKVGDAYVHGLYDERNGLSARSVSRDTAFWLQYLPQMHSLLTSPGHTEQLLSHRGDSRLRGGVIAMCGVSAMLLLLLCIGAILLYKERTYRSSASITEEINR